MIEPIATTGSVGEEKSAPRSDVPGDGFATILSSAASALTIGEFLSMGKQQVTGGASLAASSQPVPVGPAVASVHGTPSEWVEALPSEGRQWVDEIESAARDAGLDPRLLAAVVWAESDFHADAVSSAGAIGLAQLMPGTAELLGVDPFDPAENLQGGAEFLAFTIERFGSVELGLAAYNAGPGRVAEYGGAPPVTHRYIETVLGYYHRLGGKT
jgi:soluble lytic murein transglycosylase-like protein